MSKEILLVVDAVSNEKGVEKSVIFEAIEAALASATRKRYGDDIEVRVAINRTTGSYETFRRWKVFADDSKELEEPARELRLEDARRRRSESRDRRLRRAAHGVRGVRAHRGADREASHRAESARGRARAGRRGLQEPRRRARERHRQARRPQRRLRRPRRQCRRLHPSRGSDPARADQAAGPHQEPAARGPPRAARPAAVPDAHVSRSS